MMNKGGSMVGPRDMTNGSLCTAQEYNLISLWSVKGLQSSLLSHNVMNFICRIKMVKSSKLKNSYEVHKMTFSLFQL